MTQSQLAETKSEICSIDRIRSPNRQKKFSSLSFSIRNRRNSKSTKSQTGVGLTCPMMRTALQWCLVANSLQKWRKRCRWTLKCTLWRKVVKKAKERSLWTKENSLQFQTRRPSQLLNRNPRKRQRKISIFNQFNGWKTMKISHSLKAPNQSSINRRRKQFLKSYKIVRNSHPCLLKRALLQTWW